MAGVSSPSLATPRLYRSSEHGYLGGVAAGIGEHLNVSVWLIRIAFVALAFSGGLGLALYGTYWIVLPTRAGKRSARLPPWLEYPAVAIVVAAAIGSVAVSRSVGGLFVPTLLACLGGALIWRQATDPERDRWRRLSSRSLSAGRADRLGRLRLVAGAAFIISGAVLVLRRADFTALRDGLLAMVVTAVGLVLVTGPWWIKLMGQLGAERSERIRSEERADIAAHLHDSVLQTLALIQRNASSPREVARLARGQERELRDLLYGTRPASGQLADQLRLIAAEIEDAYAISIEIVLVGDAPLDDALAAAAAAAREALVNAAKHAGVTAVSLYAEVEQHTVSIFVKDRGVGFDVESIPADRQGIRNSITARVERHGGQVEVVSQSAVGTEVRIHLPRALAP